jgi:hypothetical protein
MRSQMPFWRARRQRASIAVDRLGEPGYGHSARVDPLRNEPRFKAVLAALKFPG